MNRKNKLSFLLLFIISMIFIAGCSPTAEPTESVPPTAEPTFTPAPTFTSTPIPYELEVQVVNEEGMPIAGARANVKELGYGHAVTETSNDEGKVSWGSLKEETATLDIFAQGYLPAEETVSMARGSNQAVVTLLPDPKGLQIADIINEGETLLYVEDFQDNDEDFPQILGVWSIIEDPDDPGNLVLDLNQKDLEEDATFDTPIEIGVKDFSASFKIRYLDIDYQNWNWTGFYFRDYSFGTFLQPDWRVMQLLDFNQGGEWLSPVVTQKNIQDGVWYTFSIDIYGNEIDMYVNDAQVGRFSEATDLLTQRDVNYISFGNAAGTHVQIDDIVIKLAAEKTS